MGRFDTRFRPPPVRIGLASAATQQAAMVDPASRLADAAGNYGAREARFGNVPIRLRIDKGAGPNTEPAQRALLPMGRTRRKRGYPPIVEPNIKG